jgi:hypothetical protein
MKVNANIVWWNILCAVMVVIASSDASSAQPLTPALCPSGTPPFNIHPTFRAFVSGQPGIPLLRKTIDTQAYPDALCNDGSSAVMYIRPANAAYAANPIIQPSRKWLIFIDGGGGCRNADDCLLTRWCSGGDAPFDRAGKMSSLGAWDAIHSPGGIFELTPPAPAVNSFADYNHVLVHYCSSDNWIGSATQVGITASTGTTYDIQFQGEAIVNAVFSTLLAGPTDADPVATQRFYATPLPNLQDASEIIIGGDSAGSGGVRHHIDRLREDVLTPAVADPALKVSGLLDAGATPGMWDPVNPLISWADPNSPADYRDYLLTEVEPVSRDFWGANDSALDQSCLDPLYAGDHNLVGSHPQVCYDTTYTLLNHITTPLFLRMDMNDPLGKRPYGRWNLYLSMDDYWAAQYNQLDLLRGYTAGSGGLESPLDALGIQGPNCGRHVAVLTNDGFFRHHVAGPGVPPHSFHDLLVNWLNGVGPGMDTQQIQMDNLGVGAYSPSICP